MEQLVSTYVLCSSLKRNESDGADIFCKAVVKRPFLYDLVLCLATIYVVSFQMASNAVPQYSVRAHTEFLLESLGTSAMLWSVDAGWAAGRETDHVPVQFGGQWAIDRDLYVILLIWLSLISCGTTEVWIKNKVL